MSKNKGPRVQPSSQRIPVKPAEPGAETPVEGQAEQPDADLLVLTDALRLSQKKFTEKYRRDVLERVGAKFGLAVTARRKADIYNEMRAFAANMSAAVEDEKPSPVITYAIPDPKDWDYSKPQWAVKCVRCGHTVLRFMPGFDPRRPFGPGGRRLPFWQWPFLWVAPPGQNEEDLQSRGRERPTCPACNHPVPLRNNRTTILPRCLFLLDQ